MWVWAAATMNSPVRSGVRPPPTSLELKTRTGQHHHSIHFPDMSQTSLSPTDHLLQSTVTGSRAIPSEESQRPSLGYASFDSPITFN